MATKEHDEAWSRVAEAQMGTTRLNEVKLQLESGVAHGLARERAMVEEARGE